MSGAAAGPAPARIDSLTGLRWWAAFGVFIFHMRVFAPVPGLSAVAPYGNYGVAFFFVLSGFVLTWAAARPTTVRNFYWRRFARIYPANFVALLLAIPVFYQLFPDQTVPAWVKPFDLGIVVLSALLLQAWSSNPQVIFSGNPAAWTLSVEMLFYAIHPFVLRLLRGLGTRGAAIFVISVLVTSFVYRAVRFAGVPGWWQHLPIPVTRVPEFLLGMGIALLVARGWRSHIRPLWIYLAITGWIGCQVLLRVTGRLPELSRVMTGFEPEVLVLLFGLLVLAVAERDLRGGASILRQRWLVRLGEWSFAFFLVHATVMYAVARVVGMQKPALSNLLWYPVLFALMLLVGWALYRFVEHPVELRLRKFGNRRFT